LRIEHAGELNYWNERLSRVADTNGLLLRLWIQERGRDAQTLAAFPTVKASVSGRSGKGRDGYAREHTSMILDSFRDSNMYWGRVHDHVRGDCAGNERAGNPGCGGFRHPAIGRGNRVLPGCGADPARPE